MPILPLVPSIAGIIKSAIVSYGLKKGYDYLTDDGEDSVDKTVTKYAEFINSLPEGEQKEFIKIANEQGPEAVVNYFAEKIGDTTNIPKNIQDLNTRFVNYAKTGESGKAGANFNNPTIRILSEMPPAKLYAEYEKIRNTLEETIPDKGRTYKDAFQNPTKEEAERIEDIYKDIEVLHRYAKLYDKLITSEKFLFNIPSAFYLLKAILVCGLVMKIERLFQN